MSEKYFKDQFDDEDVKVVFRKHPVVMRKGLIIACFGPLLGVVPSFIKPELGFGIFFGGLGAGFLLAVLIMLPYWASWYFSVYIMTNQRFIQQSRSLFSTSVVDISLEQVQMINYQIAGLQETLLGFGTIIVQTYVGELVIHDVHHPAKIQKKLIHELRELGIHPSQRPSGPNQQEEES